MQITFKPSIKQDQAYQYFIDKETNFIGYGGAAFSGKSYLLCYIATMMCLAYPDIGVGLGRKELTTLKRTTLITLFKVFDECGVKPDKDYSYNQQLNVITFRNDSQIFLIDTSYKPSDPLYTRMGGYELTFCLIDESAETAIEAIDILFSRCGRRNNQKYGLKAKMFETFNPDKGHIYHRYYKPWREGTLPTSYKFVKALPQDNPSPEVGDYVEDILRNGSKVTIERLIKGNFEYDDDPNSLIEYDAIVDLWTNPTPENQQKYISADIARFGEDKTVIVVWNGLSVEEVHTYKKRTTDFVAEELRNIAFREHIPYSRIIIDTDGVGGGVADNIKGTKSFVAASSPFEVETTSPRGFPEKKKPNYQNLKSQCAYLLADKINERSMSIKLLKCTGESEQSVKEKIIEELEQIKARDVDKEGKMKIVPKEDVKKLLNRSPDYGDCFIMRMYFELAPRVREGTQKVFYPKSNNRRRGMRSVF